MNVKVNKKKKKKRKRKEEDTETKMYNNIHSHKNINHDALLHNPTKHMKNAAKHYYAWNNNGLLN